MSIFFKLAQSVGLIFTDCANFPIFFCFRFRRKNKISSHDGKCKDNNNGSSYCGEDSMNTMDIYNMYMEENRYSNINNCLSPIHSPKSIN